MDRITEDAGGKKSFALVVRGYPDDFAWLVEQAKIAGLYVVFSKSSIQKLIIEEASW